MENSVTEAAKLQHQRNVRAVKNIVKRLDSGKIPVNTTEIRLFVIARNESLRLPYFLNYYKKLGVNRFFIIDNNSSDDTTQIALEYNNVHVFTTRYPYTNHWYWMEYFLEIYGMDHWCIVVDVDELIAYPYSDKGLSLAGLINYLDSNGYTAMRFLLLDIYSDKSIQESVYKKGDDPLEVCRFFDREFEEKEVILFDKLNQRSFNAIVYTGGMRERVFNNRPGSLPYHLSKISILKKSPDNYLTQGMHAVNGALLADIQGVVFHTKFMHDFLDEVKEEAKREEHFDNAIMYKIFNEALKKDPSLCMKTENSRLYRDLDQLIDLGIVLTSKNLDDYCLQLLNPMP
jgi:hypothetical protein